MLTNKISDFLHGNVDAPSILRALERNTLDNCDNRRLLKCTKRFLMRCSQYRDDESGIGDFLAALRDFVLLVGGFVVPEHVAKVVSEHGRDFGLYLDNDDFVKAEQNCFDGLIPAVFLEDIYNLNFKKGIRGAHRSLGDGVLSKVTGYDDYRSYAQKIAVHTALNLPHGSTLILSLPTGAGKSLITHMVAGVSKGLTICVVPTISLGIDQERQAKKVLSEFDDAEIAFYGGSTSVKARQEILDNLEQQILRLLIISPEALVRNERLREFLFQAAEDGYLGCLVVDEAHIVQDWGADFRPDFQLLSLLRRQLLELGTNRLRTILLSATITEHTRIILRNMFSEDGNCVSLNFDSLRTEPRYVLDKISFYGQKEARVIKYCRTLPKPLIIYETRPVEAEKWREILDDHGFRNIATFTGETNNRERNDVIEKWNNDEIDIVIGTAAFGLGIDKSDVRTVIHATVPSSINRFYQEVGRGGRDGFPSLSILLHVTKERIKSQSSILTMDKLAPRWFSMMAKGENQGPDIVLLDMDTPPEYFTATEKENRGQQNRNWNIAVILFLIRHNFIELVDLEYDQNLQGRYQVWARLLALDVLQNRDLFKAEVGKKRELENQHTRQEFDAMLTLAKGRNGCWGNHFIGLFPNADYRCSGCPAHDGAIASTQELMLEKRIPLWEKGTMPAERNRVMTGYSNLLIPKAEQMDPAIGAELSQVVRNLNLSAVIVPEKMAGFANDFPSLVLSSNEFKNVVKYHPSLLSRGVLCILLDDRAGVDTYMECRKLEKLSIPTVYFAQPDMVITPFSRSLDHLITGYTLSLDQLLEVSGGV